MNASIKTYLPTPRIIVVVMWILFITLYQLISGVFNIAITNKNNLFGETPSFDILENPSSSVASEVYYSDGEIIGKYFRDNRTPVQYDDMSKNMLNALIATEDTRFENHNGIDFRGLMAIPYYLLQGDKRGSSTITQQLAKNLYNTRTSEYAGEWIKEGGWKRMLAFKIKEWITAVRLETAYTKNEIISMYLNTVDFGSLAFGIKVAAQTFFGKHQENLTIEEAAVLVGVLKAPTYYSPVRNPENSLRRRNTVINQMHRYKYLTTEVHDSLKKLPLSLNYEVENHNSGKARYFRSVVGNYLMYWCKQNGYDLWADGLRVYTTIDSTMQEYAEKAVNEHMSYQQKLFFDHWKGKKPWSIEKENGSFEEMKDFLPRAMKRTKAYKLAKKRFDGDTIAVEKYLNTPKKTTVFGWDYENSIGMQIDTTMSPYDSLVYYKHFLHTGFMSMNPRSGEIKAWVGGIDYKNFQYDHVRQGLSLIHI